MVEIRTGEAADIEAVLHLWKTAATEASATDDAEGIARLSAYSPEALILAIDQALVIGSVIVGWDGWRGTMYRLAVMPPFRRRKIATDLVREGEARLKSWGATRLHMIVAADQTPAQGFWRTAGYEVSDQLRYVKNLS